MTKEDKSNGPNCIRYKWDNYVLMTYKLSVPRIVESPDSQGSVLETIFLRYLGVKLDSKLGENTS